MFMIEYKDLSWWYWVVTAVLLTLGLAGNEMGFILAMGLTLFQLAHFSMRERSMTRTSSTPAKLPPSGVNAGD